MGKDQEFWITGARKQCIKEQYVQCDYEFFILSVFLGSEEINNTYMKMTHRRTNDRGFTTFINKRVKP